MNNPIPTLSDGQSDALRKNLMALLAAQAGRYTQGASGSLPKETMDELLVSALYTLSVDPTRPESFAPLVGQDIFACFFQAQTRLLQKRDAALALADCCGGLDAFVQAMNEKAAALGMKDTSFANPNGLDDENHYSTARDMAVLAAYAAENPTFRRICSTKTATVGGRSMTNHNKLLRQIEGCIGMKTGYTKAAGRTLVSCAERQGRRLVAVTLCDGNDWADHKTLYEMGFAAYETNNTEETS